MKQKSKNRKRKFTTATQKKKIYMDVNCESHADQATYFAPHTLKGLGKKNYDRGNY
tara:strand:+ start:241 stop:408 length:168 start_codon:yes stop_codon:yes gene_type:complete